MPDEVTIVVAFIISLVANAAIALLIFWRRSDDWAAMLEMLAWRLDQGESPVAEICMLKNQATQTMAFCASEAVQIFGGAGFMRGVKVERIYREVKVNAIGGGTEEIMKDLASRQMGL